MSAFLQEQGFAILAAILIFVVTFMLGALLRPSIEAAGRRLQRWLRGLSSDFEKRYRRHLLDEYRVMNVRGRKTRSPVSLELERVYVSLRAQVPGFAGELRVGRRPSAFGAAPPQTRSESLTIGAALERSRRLVIIGGPGSGKTTLLTFLLLTYARRRTAQRLGFSDKLFPVFVPLRQLQDVLDQRDRRSLPDYLADGYAAQGLLPPDGFFEQRLKNGRCLVLLDGLDEVADQQQRVRLAEWVDAQVSIYPRNRFIVTSRPAGYDTAALENGFLRLEVQPFNQADIEQFCQNWCLAVELASQGEDNPALRRRAEQAATDLVRAINANPAVRALAINPLLLSIIALVHRYRATLPRRRVELYAECVDVLLGKWDQAKGLAGRLTESQKRAVLQPIALHMHQHDTRELDTPALTRLLRQHLPAVGGQPGEAELFLREVRDRSGLLLEQGLNRYTFSHLTFQEYLVARELADNGPETLLLQHTGDDWWREVTLLYTGLKDATPVVQELTQQADGQHTGLLLAGYCLLDAQKVDQTVRAATIQALEALFETGAGRPFLEAGLVLAELAEEQAVPRFLRVVAGDSEARRNAALWALEQLLEDENEVLRQHYREQLWETAFTPANEYLEPAMLVVARLAQQDETIAAEIVPRLKEAAFTPDSGLVEPAAKALADLARQDEALLEELMEAAFTPASEYVEPAMLVVARLAQQDETIATEIVSRLPALVANKQTTISQAVVALLEDDTVTKVVTDWLDYLMAKVPGAPVAIARYPVTNAQYRRFIEAGGYDEPRWWSQQGLRWRQKEKQNKPRYWQDEKWNGSAHPVVGVSWYEAEAYCNWLSEYANERIANCESHSATLRGLSLGIANDETTYSPQSKIQNRKLVLSGAEGSKIVFRLPTEAEWEQAATGGDGREYPWGNGWREGVCNTSEAGIGRTTPVGQFSPTGDSPTGCADMAGNVWAWCGDWYDKEGNRRVVRGGAWGNGQDLARCAVRSRNYPSSSYDFYGFRVVSPILGSES